MFELSEPARKLLRTLADDKPRQLQSLSKEEKQLVVALSFPEEPLVELGQHEHYKTGIDPEPKNPKAFFPGKPTLVDEDVAFDPHTMFRYDNGETSRVFKYCNQHAHFDKDDKGNRKVKWFTIPKHRAGQPKQYKSLSEIIREDDARKPDDPLRLFIRITDAGKAALEGMLVTA